MFGVFNGDRRIPEEKSLKRLDFPHAYPRTTDTRYEPSTAIRQYSTGRRSVLGLAEDGKVWMWQNHIGFQIKPMHVDMTHHRVKKVVAGK